MEKKKRLLDRLPLGKTRPGRHHERPGGSANPNSMRFSVHCAAKAHAQQLGAELDGFASVAITTAAPIFRASTPNTPDPPFDLLWIPPCVFYQFL